MSELSNQGIDYKSNYLSAQSQHLNRAITNIKYFEWILTAFTQLDKSGILANSLQYQAHL